MDSSKKDSGESNRAKYARVISDLLRKITFHVNTLTYSFWFNLLLYLDYLADLSIPIPSDTCESDHLPDPGTP